MQFLALWHGEYGVAMIVGCSIAVTPQCIVESDLDCVSDGDSPKLATRPFLLRGRAVLAVEIGEFRLARRRSP